jgi:hypothetical protein
MDFVAMLAASAVPHAEAAAAAALFAFGRAGFVFVRRMCRRPRRPPPLRLCPLCGSDAVRAFEYELVDALQARVLQQCGACGAWRQIVSPLDVAARHERTLEADRNAIRRDAERLERSRVLSDTNAFVAVLQDDIVSSEDLLAMIAAETSARDQSR